LSARSVNRGVVRPASLVWTFLTALAASPAAAQNPYSYAKFSLQVPWTLYFVFLALISIPFAVMMLLAWRRGRGEEELPEPETGGGQESASAVRKDERSS